MSGAPEPPGGFLHGEHPFLRPEAERDPVRRLRGRLAAPVTLWTAGTGADRAGLTVSSVLVAEPDRLAGLLGDETDVLEVLERTGAFCVSVLDRSQRALADAFSFLSPAPGGPFRLAEWTATDWGPVPAGAATWAGCRVQDVRDLGYSRLVEAVVEHVELTAEPDAPGPLVWRRGRYQRLG